METRIKIILILLFLIQGCIKIPAKCIIPRTPIQPLWVKVPKKVPKKGPFPCGVKGLEEYRCISLEDKELLGEHLEDLERAQREMLFALQSLNKIADDCR